jgi:hypothetical protein
MKIIFVASLLAALLPGASALAQDPLPTACGPAAKNFEAATGEAKSPPAPEAGMVLVYFILDDGPAGKYQHFTIRAGMDGTWVAAFKHNAYVALQVTPGEHHVCVNVQSNFSIGEQAALAHFKAEAGKMYYFRARYMAGLNTQYPVYPNLELDQPDTDEAQYLIGLYPVGTWHEKK